MRVRALLVLWAAAAGYPDIAAAQFPMDTTRIPVLRVGVVVRGTLTAADTACGGGPCDLYRFRVARDEQDVIVTLRSTAFDPNLEVGMPTEGREFFGLHENDSGCEVGLNSQIEFVANGSTQYIVVVTPSRYADRTTGSYLLSLHYRRSAAPRC